MDKISRRNFVKDMGVRPTQLTENRKNRLAKLFRILTCQMCRPDTHALTPSVRDTGWELPLHAPIT